ncbi:MAG: hypothetical protein K8T90_08000 [Planctomycetes bacterium]|nr:hypothetical protein [Planctomycetota bacterium]
MLGVRRFVSVLVLALVAGALVACQGLAQALGANPAATAPAYNGIGLIAQPGAEVKVYGSPNQSGPVGASGSASAQADMAQTTEVGAEAIDALLSAAQDAIAGGATPVANTLIERAKTLGGAKHAKSTKGPAAPADSPPPNFTEEVPSSGAPSPPPASKGDGAGSSAGGGR